MSEIGETRNLSSKGVLFSLPSEINIDDPIEYVISFPAGQGFSEPVDLQCIGKVVRYDSSAQPAPLAGKSFEVAATLERYEFIRSE